MSGKLLDDWQRSFFIFVKLEISPLKLLSSSEHTKLAIHPEEILLRVPKENSKT